MFECMFDEISQHPPTDNVKRIGCGPRRPANSIEVPETQPSSSTSLMLYRTRYCAGASHRSNSSTAAGIRLRSSSNICH